MTFVHIRQHSNDGGSNVRQCFNDNNVMCDSIHMLVMYGHILMTKICGSVSMRRTDDDETCPYDNAIYDSYM